jgi:hypothetical protein
MFEHFTFGAQAQTRYDREDLSASPCDTSFVQSPPTSFPFPDPQGNPVFDDIVNKFGQHSLRPEDNEDARPSIRADTVEGPTFDDEPFTVEELSYVSTTRGLTTVHYFTPSFAPAHINNIASRREQRQQHTQLQACSSHIRDISALVEDMIQSNSQCNLRKSTSRPYLLSPPRSRPGSNIPTIDDLIVDETDEQQKRQVPYDEDEGFAEMEEVLTLQEEEMSLRRASTPSGIRKHDVRYKASSESLASTASSFNGVRRDRASYRCVPRMRKRTTKIARVLEE